ncbi:amidophosphoribosyltransferase [Massilia violaceinigra]|uniref:Amidophosphoribosyltransferase n=1 Tax=Massilia violaceinigra TaxID=2045208 RepID=A0A2D2DHF5_9BURK|nr:ComF family protein [Massilia violaceinigra]ATQ74417.1 amidophosphoribosyltransferase [Massilia violaceinigra]
MSAWPQRDTMAGMLRALLPSTCALCGEAADAAVCAPCARQFVAAGAARCRRCANPLGGADAGLACGACLADAPAYDATVAASDYASPLDQLVLRLKFGGALALAPWCARTLHAAVLAAPGFALPELLCPVPLGPARLSERGYNQALEIARPLSTLLGIALQPRLTLRRFDTPAQSGATALERKNNMRHAFLVAPDMLAQVRGRHIGVVDDVMTSGHTLNALAATLKRFGAARVSNLVFARTPPH